MSALRDALKELRVYCGQCVDDPNASEDEQIAYDDIAIQLAGLLEKHPEVDVAAFEASAWHAGHQTGWEHHQNGEHGNDYWDCDCKNPHRSGERS